MLKLADGGALYCYSNLPPINFGNTWRNNVIVNVVGNVDGVPPPSSKQANGIMLDANVYDFLVEGNTVIRAASNGVQMSRNSYRNTIRSNLFYDCGRDPGGYYLYFLLDPTRNYGQNVIVKNVFYPLDSVQTLVMIQDSSSSLHMPGTLDSNYYCSPYNNLPIRTLTFANKWIHTEYSLEQWQAYSGQDQHSKGLFTKLNPFVVTDSSAPSLIPNGQFQTNIAGWGDWNNNTQVKYVDNAGLDGGCVEFRLEGGPGTNRALASPNVVLVKGQWYQLRFSVRAAHEGLLTVATRQDHSPYSTLNAPMVFSMGPERTNQECYLMADASDSQVRVEFRVTYPDSLFFLDNVTFRPVKGDYVSPESQAPVFVNSTPVTKTVDLGPDSFRDLDGNYLSSSIELPPYSSKILIREGYSALPVQLASLNAVVAGDGEVQISWSTVSEVNNYGFTVQRKSVGDADFADLNGAFVAGKGTTTEPQAYTYVDKSIVKAGTYSYRLKQQDLDGTIHYTQSVIVQVTVTDMAEVAPKVFQLLQNYPNPFNPTTVVSYQLPVVSDMKLVAYDLLGREVAVLVNERKAPGIYNVQFDALGLASGVYVYRLTAGNFVQARKMIVIK
jgi:hypothetical protein